MNFCNSVRSHDRSAHLAPRHLKTFLHWASDKSKMTIKTALDIHGIKLQKEDEKKTYKWRRVPGNAQEYQITKSISYFFAT